MLFLKSSVIWSSSERNISQCHKQENLEIAMENIFIHVSYFEKFWFLFFFIKILVQVYIQTFYLYPDFTNVWSGK